MEGKLNIAVIIELVLGLFCLFIFMKFLPRCRRFPKSIIFLTGFIFVTIFLQILHKISLDEMGLRFDTFWPAIKLLGPFSAIVVLALVIVGLVRKKAIINRYFLITFLLYPAWALCQQYLILCFFFPRFQIIFGINILSILLCAVIFSWLHYPDKLFMGICFIGALIWTSVFIMAPNLFVSAFFHGWIGTLIYYFALGENRLIT